MRTISKVGIVAFSLGWMLIGAHRLNAEVRQETEVIVASYETIEDDLYIFGQRVVVDGSVKGDLIVFGSQISINGSVEGDLIAAAQSIEINGTVDDDARLAAQLISLHESAEVGDDLIAASYRLQCGNGSRVSGELKHAGYQSVLAGRVEKKVELATARAKLSGSFGSDVQANINRNDFPVDVSGSETPSVLPGITVTESANIGGSFSYQSSREAIIHPDATVGGEINHTPSDSDASQSPKLIGRIVSVGKQFFALMLVGALVVFFLPNWTRRVVSNVEQRPLGSMAWGGLTLVMVVALAVLMLIATIAVAVLLGYISLDNLISAWLWSGLLSTALLIVGTWVFSTWITKVIFCVWAGSRIIRGRDWSPGQRLVALAIGALILVALITIPIVGAGVTVVVTLLGLGSTAIGVFRKAPLVSGNQNA